MRGVLSGRWDALRGGVRFPRSQSKLVEEPEAAAESPLHPEGQNLMSFYSPGTHSVPRKSRHTAMPVKLVQWANE